MKPYKAILICWMFNVAFLAVHQPQVVRAQWHAGTWDSTIYNRAEHPRTVGLRIEIVDSQTQIPLEGIQVRLWGKYIEEWVGTPRDWVGSPPRPQEKEFRMDAVTDNYGVVIFALQWQKEYPWHSYFGDHAPRDYRKNGGWSTKQSWIVAVDDIEKVQRIEIRHPKYHYKQIPFNFKHLLEFGQRKWSVTQSPELFDKFEQAWIKEIKKKNVRFCVLDLGTKFPDFQNKKSKRPEFFEKIHSEDWGTVYQKPENWFSVGEHPQSQCGPYFVYLFDDIPLVKRTTEIEVTGITSEEPEQARVSTSEAQCELQMQEWACSACGHVYRGNSTPKFCPECGRAFDQTAGVTPSGSESPGQGSQSLKMELAKLSDLSLPSLEEIRNDPTKLADLVKKAGAMKNDLAIAGIRTLLMVDPQTKQMTTLDAYARKLAESKQLGGSLGEDPIATTYMMLIDSNFLVDEARIIRLKDGQYVSLTEAIGLAETESNSGLDPEVLKRAVRTGASLHQASRLNNGQLMTKALTSFPFAVSELNAFGGRPKALDDLLASKGEVIHCPELSMSLKTLTPELCKEMGLYVGTKGSVIVQIDPDAPPGHEDLKPGMVIHSWYHKSVPDVDALVSKAEQAVTNLATMRAGGRDQVLLSIMKWNGMSWEYGDEMVWVVGKKDTDAANADVQPDRRPSGRGKDTTINLGGGITMDFVLIPAGSFSMDSPSDEKDRDSDEGPVRRVQITKPFYMGKFEVTQDQYNAVMRRNPSHFSGRDLPVESVSWLEATQFCEKLTAEHGGRFRLPTEAEWEYACRAGSETRFYYGDDPDYTELGEYAWYSGNSDGKTHSVGQKRPNQFGLYDMHGNVWEWCSDYYASTYQNLDSIDPQGPSSGRAYRVLRGGCWDYDANNCRVASRYYYYPDDRCNRHGFRIVLDLE